MAYGPGGHAPLTLHRIAGLTAVAAIVAGIVVAMLTRSPDPVALKSGTAMPKRQPVPEFALVDQHGRAFAREALEGRWSLVFTGFTNCPDICPTTLALLATLSARLRERGEELQPVFVSVDPERDTPEVLAGYVGHFNEHMIGVTGTQPQIDGLCDALGLAYVRNPGPGGEYTVDHSAALVLIDPQARAAAYFQPPFDPDALVADLLTLMDGAG